MIIDFFSSQLINAFISHVRNLEFGRCLNDSPRIQIGECEIQYTCGTFRRQVVCLFHDIPCVRTGGRHLVLFRFHYWNKGISCVQPFVGSGSDVARAYEELWRSLCLQISPTWWLAAAHAHREQLSPPFRDFANIGLGSTIGWELP